ncbi:MAG: O-methyltransferase [Thermoanaerobaculia bacterium]
MINYSLRPAKQTERKMVADFLRRLAVFAPLSTYRYVGMGSYYFRDFQLFHRALGISDMISIEGGGGARERYVLNRPFNCVEIRFGHSNALLPALEWGRRAVVWMDYDDPLTPAVFADINTFFGAAREGSAFLITVNAAAPHDNRVEELRQRVGAENVPIDVNESALAGWGTAEVARRIIDNKIADALRIRNVGRVVGERVCYRQCVNFRYSDNAKMLTTGGFIYDEAQPHLLTGMFLNTLDFVRSGAEPYKIPVPNLTYRELRYLNQNLPLETPDSGSTVSGIPPKEVSEYQRVYRYFPVFAETDAD